MILKSKELIKMLSSDGNPKVSADNIIENLPVGICVYLSDGEGNVTPLFLSTRAYTLFDVPQNDRTVFAKQSFSMFEPFIGRRSGNWEPLLKGSRIEFNLVAQQRDGTGLPLSVVSSLVCESDGIYMYFMSILDITARMQQETQSGVQKEPNKILRDVGNVTFEYDVTHDVMFFEVMKPNGVSKSENIEDFLKSYPRKAFVEPQFQERLKQAFIEASTKEVNKTMDFQSKKFGRSGQQWCRAFYVSVPDERGKMLRVVGRIENIEDEKQRRIRESVLQHRANHDHVTGLYNKSTGEDLIHTAIEMAYATQLCTMFVLDIDDFKMINDKLGHLEGDKVLNQVGKVISQCFRSGDIACRFGGDEFVVFALGMSESDIRRKANYILSAINDIYNIEDKPLSCSIGIAMDYAENASYGELFANADKSLYAAKALGKNRFFISAKVEMGEYEQVKIY